MPRSNGLAYRLCLGIHSGAPLPCHFPNSFPERKIEAIETDHLPQYGGNCAEALHFYEQHLGGKIITMQTYAEYAEPKNIPPGLEKGCVRPHRDRIRPDGRATARLTNFEPVRSVDLALS